VKAQFIRGSNNYQRIKIHEHKTWGISSQIQLIKFPGSPSTSNFKKKEKKRKLIDQREEA